jgi:hypothetical protein
MNSVIKFIRNNWRDQVWSTVFSTGIIAAITSISLLIWSLVKRIPYGGIWKALLTETVQVRYLTIVITVILILAFLLPMIVFGVISFQLKHLKLSKALEASSVNYETFINGQWRCEFRKETTGEGGGESLTISEGNKYKIGGKLVFVLTNIIYDKKAGKISWVKTSYPSGTKYSRETLSILGEQILSGKDDTGFVITYIKKGQPI